MAEEEMKVLLGLNWEARVEGERKVVIDFDPEYRCFTSKGWK